MSPVQAPKCQREGCDNPTWYGLCHHHKNGQNAPQGASQAPGGQPQLNGGPMAYTSTPFLWIDLRGAFPDIGDVVHPETIHQQAVGTLQAAVDAEVFRAFPSMNIEDYEQREVMVAELRQRIMTELYPEANRVTAEEARDLSHSSADVWGRSLEDSKYLAAFALNAEWECHRLMGTTPVDGAASFEQFVESVADDMQQAVDLSFRKNLGEFSDIVREATGRGAVNPHQIAPHLAIAPSPSAPPQVNTQINTDDALRGRVLNEEQAQAVSDFFERQRSLQDEAPRQVDAQPQSQQEWSHEPVISWGGQNPQHSNGSGYTEQMDQQGRPAAVSLSGLLKRGADALNERIEDKDGVYAARRIAANQERQRKEAERQQKIKERQAREDEELERRAKRSLVEQREERVRRSKKSRGFFG